MIDRLNPNRMASVSLRPIRANSGSVNMQNGTCHPVVTRWPPATMGTNNYARSEGIGSGLLVCGWLRTYWTL
jgi:hypothetical protein